MKPLKLKLLICCCLLALSACTGIITNVFIKDLDWRKSSSRVKRIHGVKIPMQDSILLNTDIYHPKGISPAPSILIRVPLDKNQKSRTRSKVFGQLWASRGYNVIIQGVRGRYGSEGEHVPFIFERNDGIATLNWIKNQKWHNGKLGMWGGSYFGYTQWVLFDQKVIGPDALFVHISSSSNYDMFYPGSAFALETALFWAVRSHAGKDMPMKYKDLKKAYESYDLSAMDQIAVKDIPFYNDWVKHQTKDSFWNAIDGNKRIESLEMPVLMMAGWYDPFLNSQIQDFIDLKNNPNPEVRQNSRLIIGPWGHARTITMPNGYTDQKYRVSSIEHSLDWYDMILKKTGENKMPQVRLFVMGLNVWRSENEFPLARTVYTKYYLNSNGQASADLNSGTLDDNAGTDSKDTFTYDPANPVKTIGGCILNERSGIFSQNSVELRTDVLKYSSRTLEYDLEITGPIELILYVSTDAVNTDFTAKLCDVYPDGNAYNLAEGIIRRSYISNEVCKITIQLNPISNVFLKGHKIRLEVSSSNYPRYSRNFNTGNNLTGMGMKKAKQTVYTGKLYSSCLILPIIPKN